MIDRKRKEKHNMRKEKEKKKRRGYKRRKLRDGNIDGEVRRNMRKENQNEKG